MQNYGFLGSDVSKGMCNFVLVDFFGQELESNFQLDDNKEGHQALYSLLEELLKVHGLSKIIVGVESTGGYENNWYHGLRRQSKKLSLEVFRINPKRIYHEAKTEGRRSVTDGVSAQVIAGYLRKNYGQKDLEPKRLEEFESTTSGRTLYKYIQLLTKQSTQVKNTFEKVLYSYLPELLSMKSEKYADWFLDLLIAYPSSRLMLSAGIEGLTEIKRLGITTATKIIEGLENSIGNAGDIYIEMTIREQAKDLKKFKQKIKRLKASLVILAKKESGEDFDLINSIRGIGEDTAAGLVYELGDIKRFEKGSNLVAFWGINPTFKQSGDKKYKVGMSKDGSPVARGLMYMGAKNVVIHEPYFAALYQRQRKKGKGYRSALGVVMSKLTRVVFGMLKNRKPFDPGIDTFNQTKVVETKKVNQESNRTERRYQQEEKTAPISRRQKKKRTQVQNVSIE